MDSSQNKLDRHKRYKETLGKAANTLRRSRGLSKQKMSKQSGLAYQTIMAVEAGTGDTGIGTLLNYAHTIGYDLSDFCDLASNPHESSQLLPIIANNIQKIRYKLNMDVEQFSYATNISVGVVEQIEAALKPSDKPTIDYLQIVAEALDIDIEELVKRDPLVCR